MIFNILLTILTGLNMDGIPQASLFLGIIPALVILYISLKDYEGEYKDKTIFISFIGGIILGALAVLARFLNYSPPMLIVYIVVFAFFDQLIKTIILNLKRLQKKRTTPLYGLSLGLGFGSVFTPFLIIAASTSPEYNLYHLVLITIGSFGIILFHASTATLIGYGVYQGQLIKYLFFAIILQIPFNTVYDITRNYSNEYYPIFQIILIIYGLILYLYIIRKTLPLVYKTKRKRRNT